MAAREPLDELGDLQERSKRQVEEALHRLTETKFRGDPRAFRLALDNLGGILSRTGALADLLGRRRLFLELDARGRQFARRRPLTAVPIIPNVSFQEAVDSLLEREPRLVSGWEEAQRAYTEGRGFALARSADLQLTAAIQRSIASLIRKGATLEEAEQQLLSEATKRDPAGALGWTRSYAETVYRTNLNTSFNAGRMRQARDPAVRAVVPGFRFAAVGDVDTRKNHKAADGFIAAQGDPVWQRLAPPLGFSCRCSLSFATEADLRNAGVIRGNRVFQQQPPRGAGADPGFVKLGRPDQEIYGGP